MQTGSIRLAVTLIVKALLLTQAYSHSAFFFSSGNARTHTHTYILTLHTGVLSGHKRGTEEMPALIYYRCVQSDPLIKRVLILLRVSRRISFIVGAR